MHEERAAIRRQMRARRRELGGDAKLRADETIRRTIRMLGAYRRARRVAMFFAFDGEPSLSELMLHAISRGKEVFVPVIDDEMTFAAINAEMDLVTNDFGIIEPQGTQSIAPRDLDLVLTPLVAFDDRGTRIGVGRAYYDRCFAFLANLERWRRPRLLGVAYSFQQAATVVERAAWDVPLWGVATELGARFFAPD